MRPLRFAIIFTLAISGSAKAANDDFKYAETMAKCSGIHFATSKILKSLPGRENTAQHSQDLGNGWFFASVYFLVTMNDYKPEKADQIMGYIRDASITATMAELERSENTKTVKALQTECEPISKLQEEIIRMWREERAGQQ
jgi:hypothetical protein